MIFIYSKAKVKSAIEVSLNEDLPESYDSELFRSRIDLFMNHFIDMAIQGYEWVEAWHDSKSAGR